MLADGRVIPLASGGRVTRMPAVNKVTGLPPGWQRYFRLCLVVHFPVTAPIKRGEETRKD